MSEIDRNMTAEVAKAKRFQRCEACDAVVPQSELRPSNRRSWLLTRLICRDCEKAGE